MNVFFPLQFFLNSSIFHLFLRGNFRIKFYKFTFFCLFVLAIKMACNCDCQQQGQIKKKSKRKNVFPLCKNVF